MPSVIMMTNTTLCFGKEQLFITKEHHVRPVDVNTAQLKNRKEKYDTVRLINDRELFVKNGTMLGRFGKPTKDRESYPINGNRKARR